MFQAGDVQQDRRRDNTMAAVIDEAIRFDQERGAALAWAFLASHGLSPETILRVLSHAPDGAVPRRQATH